MQADHSAALLKTYFRRQNNYEMSFFQTTGSRNNF